MFSSAPNNHRSCFIIIYSYKLIKSEVTLIGKPGSSSVLNGYWNISNILVQEILLSESSESSDEEHDPVTEDDFKEMLQLHKEQKLCRRKYMLDKNVRYIISYTSTCSLSCNKAWQKSFEFGVSPLYYGGTVVSPMAP